MARDSSRDPGQQFAFHIVDISDWPGIPFLQDAMFVDASFSAISGPQITLIEEEFKPINGPNESFTTGYNAGPITLTRGVIRQTSDLWNWTSHFMNGDRKLFGGGYRKDFMLFQLQPGAKTIATTIDLNWFSWTDKPGNFYPSDPQEVVRAWSLFKCKPVDYQPATGWDALSDEVVSANLVIKPSQITEWGLGAGGGGIIGTAVSLAVGISDAA